MYIFFYDLFSRNFFLTNKKKLIRMLQARTLPDATPPIGKILSFSKMTVTLEPLTSGFDALWDLESS